jgi:hypothetical protein
MLVSLRAKRSNLVPAKAMLYPQEGLIVRCRFMGSDQEGQALDPRFPHGKSDNIAIQRSSRAAYSHDHAAQRLKDPEWRPTSTSM